jgi:hypothetical protein
MSKRKLCIFSKTEESSDREICENNYVLETWEMKIYYVNTRKFQKCPHVELHIGGYPVILVVDSGSEATISSQELFNKLASSSTKILLILITGAVLISAWGNRTKKIETQALVPFEISCGYFEQKCIITPDMIDCILGA